MADEVQQPTPPKKKSWKTTLWGILGGAAAVVAQNPQAFGKTGAIIAAVVSGGAITGLGLAAKDHDVTGSGK